jgi:GTP-binding protein
MILQTDACAACSSSSLHGIVQGQCRVKYEIPTRGLLGLKNALLSSTKGTAVLNTQFLAYKEYLGDFSTRENGSLVAFETGQVTAYALTSAQERGILFVKPGDQVYEGQVTGIHQRSGDLKVNVCKKKALTNMRAAGKDKCAIIPCRPVVLSIQ